MVQRPSRSLRGGSGILVGVKKADISLRLFKIVLVPNSLGPGHVDSSEKRGVISKKSEDPIYRYSIRYRKALQVQLYSDNVYCLPGGSARVAERGGVDGTRVRVVRCRFRRGVDSVSRRPFWLSRLGMSREGRRSRLV